MAWQLAKTERVKLTSGNEPLLREVDPAALILHNMDSEAVPEWLAAQVINQFKTGKVKEAMPDFDRVSIPVYGRFIDLVVRAAMVEPRIVETPNYEAGEIAMSDVRQSERMEIFAWAMPQKEFAAAEKFPPQSDLRVEPAHPVEGIPSITQ